MEQKKLPAGLRKHVRKEKARIRRGVFGLTEQREEIAKLYLKVGRVQPASSQAPKEVLQQKEVKAQPVLAEEGA
ncbi:hypothetical protein KKI17_01800 [Patescibacteria group bacterium]|nr:hypothetical protein [Patescibacteria group bacterium]